MDGGTFQRVRRIRDHLQPASSLNIWSDTFELESNETSVIDQSPPKSGGLDAFRRSATFDTEEMKRFIVGREYDLRERIYKTLSGDPLFRQPILELNLTRKEMRELCQKQVHRLVEYDFVTEEENSKEPWRAGSALVTALNAYDTSLSAKFGLHYGMFINCIKNLGTDRHKKYIPLCEQLRIIGCFALTELSHGSNARAIETTATFDQDAQEFVIHSPSHTSYKWWIGLAGKTANYTCLIARLILKGKDLGIHPFLVPLRSMHDHNTFAGVMIGDLGEKIGHNGLDHGFIAFNQYRIPRENLLNKIGDVLPDGTYTAENIHPNKRFALLLNPLSAGRVGIVGYCNSHLITALTIAIRYSACRKQFGLPNQEELPVLEYSLQQYRLLPGLAASYAIEVFRYWLFDVFGDYMKILTGGGNVKEDLSAELHAIVSAAKPIAGWIARDYIQASRECCGGHGYSAYNRLGVARADHEPNLTYEGDNFVLIQQTSRYLIDQYQRKLSGKRMNDPLNTVAPWLDENLLESKSAATSTADFFNSDVYLRTMLYRIALSVHNAAQVLQESLGEGKSSFEAWNDVQVFYLHNAAKAYIEWIIVRHFVRTIENLESAPIKTALKDLAALLALTRIENDLSNCRENEHLSAAQVQLLRRAILELCKKVKVNAVALVDAIAPPDELLFSPIGKSNGNPYVNFLSNVMGNSECFERAPWWELMQTPTVRGSRRNWS
eukprot:TRINITY_DN1598_c0_g1_i4.p1 TRINITY_DN1598_c0_g1~~TRINITY_DN1598_c0_g1_i4.p1  ORF type:complete len:722 (-),score=135.85 TRINITY_DN1598_c0_g1_i4:45-2210(-)